MNIIGESNDKRRFSMDYFTTTEVAKLWGVSSRRIAILCEQNRVKGVLKKGKTWLIPSDALKPSDARKSNKGQKD
jgi:hypothetical protein